MNRIMPILIGFLATSSIMPMHSLNSLARLGVRTQRVASTLPTRTFSMKPSDMHFEKFYAAAFMKKSKKEELKELQASEENASGEAKYFSRAAWKSAAWSGVTGGIALYADHPYIVVPAGVLSFGFFGLFGVNAVCEASTRSKLKAICAQIEAKKTVIKQLDDEAQLHEQRYGELRKQELASEPQKKSALEVRSAELLNEKTVREPDTKDSWQDNGNGRRRIRVNRTMGLASGSVSAPASAAAPIHSTSSASSHDSATPMVMGFMMGHMMSSSHAPVHSVSTVHEDTRNKDEDYDDMHKKKQDSVDSADDDDEAQVATSSMTDMQNNSSSSSYSDSSYQSSTSYESSSYDSGSSSSYDSGSSSDSGSSDSSSGD